MSLVALANGDLLLLGGKNGDGIRNDTWRSSDAGVSWTFVSETSSLVFSSAIVALPSGSLLRMGGIGESTVDAAIWRSDPPDVGTTWALAVPAAPWGGRYKGVATVRGDGAVLFAGGRDADGIAYNDVYASFDDGVSWTQLTAKAEWSPRAFFGMCSFPDSSVLVIAGATAVVNFLGDVWRSDDGGVSFVQLQSPPWPRASGTMAVVHRGSAFVVHGDIEDDYDPAFVYRSDDRGESWAVVGAAPWGVRRRMGFTVLPDGTLVVAGGKDDDGLAHTNMVFVGAPAPGSVTWFTDSCEARKRALCSARPWTSKVSVSLRAAAGVVTPANSAPVKPLSLVHSPPVPTLARSSGQQLVAVDDVVVFDISFSSPVTSVAASDFFVRVDGGAVLLRSLSGGGTQWALSLTLDPGAVHGHACPPGYEQLPTTSMCVRVLETAAAWPQQRALCQPYDLASIHSEEEHNFIASLRSAPVEDYWCVSGCGCSSSPPLLVRSRSRLIVGGLQAGHAAS